MGESGNIFLQLLPTPAPCIWASLGEDRQMAKWRRKKEEVGEGDEAPGLCKESVWDGTLHGQEDLRPDTQSRRRKRGPDPLPLQGSCTLVV